MRTTLSLDDDVFQAVRSYADSRSVGLGKAGFRTGAARAERADDYKGRQWNPRCGFAAGFPESHYGTD